MPPVFDSDNLPIYAELVNRAESVLEHFVEDLEVHDKQTLTTKVQPGQTWLWQVRKTGTWLVRWDEDPNGGSKDSLVECLIRGAQHGNWGNPQWYLLHCKERRGTEVYGIVSNPIPVEKLAAALPRPKPKPVLPGERRYAIAGGRR
jgi:hypothetical protein